MPRSVLRFEASRVSYADKPKSQSFITPFFDTRMLSDFMSLWIIFRLWMAARPYSAFNIMYLHTFSSSVPWKISMIMFKG